MWIKKDVVMLPTNEKVRIWLNKFSNQLHLDTIEKENHKDAINQHIYVLSNDEIKEGDWFYWYDSDGDSKYIWQCNGLTNTHLHVKYTNNEFDFPEGDWNKCYAKKIIATTNESLFKHQKESIFLQERIFYLPQIQQSFIQHYIEQYNKGNIITEVDVEYDNDYEEPEGDIIKLVINPDNTINIKPIKDSWNREEFVTLIRQYTEDINNPIWFKKNYNDFNDWIEQNL